MRGVNVVALYGGQRYDVQLRALRQGPQIVVGTPGRLLDHLKRGTLDLSKLSGLVLDEADEMLRMGFIEDVETIMAQIPEGHQTALFSATMPEAIRRITRRFMKEPQEVRIQSSVTTRPDISQSYWTVWGMRKTKHWYVSRKRKILMRRLSSFVPKTRLWKWQKLLSVTATTAPR